MRELGGFSDAARPVFETLGAAAPTITRATRLLGPFSDATTVSLRSLGDAAEEAGPDLRAADPIVRKLRGLAFAAQRPATNLSRLTGSLRAEDAFESLMRFFYNTAGSLNGFDRFGHYLRTNILVSSCIEYQTFPLSGCVANFTGPGTAFPRNAFTPEAVARSLGLAQAGEDVRRGDRAAGARARGSTSSPSSATASPPPRNPIRRRPTAASRPSTTCSAHEGRTAYSA